MRLLALVLGGNTLQTWMIAVLVSATALVALWLAKRLIGRFLAVVSERTKSETESLASKILARTGFWFLLAVSLYLGLSLVDLPERAAGIVSKVMVVLVFLQVGLWGNVIVTHLVARNIKARLGEDDVGVATVYAVGFMARLILWAVVFLLILENLGVNITTLVAGLGIGGIAVALAVQNILGDLFGSLSILLDKPFVIGDFIIVDNYMGTVEHIGLKSTRIRSLSGEQLIFSNSDLLKSRIRNYKRMYERRVVFSLGVTYETPYEKLERIPVLIREVIEAQPGVRFDRAHFNEYGPFSLNFEVVYYVLNPDYDTYMDIQQAINLAIFRRFKEEEIDFAYPTQTLYHKTGPQLFAVPVIPQTQGIWPTPPSAEGK